jgi:sec-independent protein translocase protein TatA
MDFTGLYILLGMIGPWQIVIIILVVVLLFGGKKIPELFKGVGQGLKEFKDATGKDNKDEKENIEEKK